MKINYSTFIRLYGEAQRLNYEHYIADRGWQSWMNDFSDEDVAQILNDIFEISKMTLPEIRQRQGLSRVELSRRLRMPLRTLENWESGEIGYKETLLIYALLSEVADDEQD